MTESGPNWVLAPGVCKERIGEEMVLLDTEAGQYFELNESGARMVELLDDLGSCAAVLEALAQEYEADASLLAGELDQLIQQLHSQKLLVPRSG